MTVATLSQARPLWRSLGFWLCVVMALAQALNAVRSFIEPIGFAVYMGAPLANAGDTAFVQFYGLRCAFIAVMIATFLWLRNLDAMRWIALVGSPIPLADAWLAWQSGAPTFTIGRHIAIAIYIFVAFVVLSRQAKGARV
jgi:hypothetical protein